MTNTFKQYFVPFVDFNAITLCITLLYFFFSLFIGFYNLNAIMLITFICLSLLFIREEKQL